MVCVSADHRFDFIVEDSGVQHMEHDSDEHDDEIAGSASEDSAEEDVEEDNGEEMGENDAENARADDVDEDLE